MPIPTTPITRRCYNYNCQVQVPETEMTRLSGAYFCPRCTAENSRQCADCGTVGYRSYMHGSPIAPHNPICDTCYDSYPYCDWCEENYDPESRTHDNCGPGEKIHGDGHKPRFVMHGTGNLRFGFELEIPCQDNVGIVLDEHFGDNESQMYVKTDGSVYDGYEVCTMPRTLESYQEWDWSWMDAIVRKARAQDPDEGNTGHGLHVHISRAGFRSVQHQGRFYLFFKRAGNRELIEHMAGRRSNDWSSFHAMANYGWADIVGTRNTGYPARYAVLNMCNRDTIEFRLGCATTNKDKILGLIEFLAAVVEYTLKTEDEHEKSWQELIAWVKRGSRRKQRYANFLSMAGAFAESQLVPA